MDNDFVACCVAQSVALRVEPFPHDEGLDGTHIECFESVDDTETVLARVERDFVKVFLNQTLLNDEFDVGERVGGQLDSLCH